MIISSTTGSGCRSYGNSDIVDASMSPVEIIDDPSFTGEEVVDDIVFDVDAAADVVRTWQLSTSMLDKSRWPSVETGLTLTDTADPGETVTDWDGIIGSNDTGIFACTLGLPDDPVGLIADFGGGNSGAYIGFRGDSTFVARCGDGKALPQNDAAAVELAPGTISGGGRLVVEFSASRNRTRVWWNNVLVGETVSVSNIGDIGGNDGWGYLTLVSGGQVGEVQTPLNPTYASEMSMYAGQIIGETTPFVGGIENLTPEVATIDDSGILQRVADGTAEVRVTDGITTRGFKKHVTTATGVESRDFKEYAHGSYGKSMVDVVSAGIAGMTKADNGSLYDSQNHSTPAFTRNDDAWIPASYLTGISPSNSNANNRKAGTAITPRHIVFAKHYGGVQNPFPIGTTFRFVTTGDAVVERTLVGKASDASSDISVGTLDSDLPSSIVFYPVVEDLTWSSKFTPGSDGTSNYGNGAPPLVVLDQQEKALLSGTRQLGYSSVLHAPWSFFSTYSIPTAMDFSEFSETIVVGDSGNPAFGYTEDGLLLFGVHWQASLFPITTKENLDPLIAASDANAGVTTGHTATAYSPHRFTNYSSPDPEGGATVTDTMAPNGFTSAWYGLADDGEGTMMLAWEMTIPDSPSGLIFEGGGTGFGSSIYFLPDGTFVARCGDSSSDVPNGDDCAYVILPPGEITGHGTMMVEMRVLSNSISVYWNRRLVGHSIASSAFTKHTGSDPWSFFRDGGEGDRPVGTPSSVLSGANPSDLRLYAGQGFLLNNPSYAQAVRDDYPMATFNLDGSPQVFAGSDEKYPIGDPGDGKKLGDTGPGWTMEAIVSLDALTKDGTIIGRWGDTDVNGQKHMLVFDEGGSAPGFGWSRANAGGGTIVVGEDPSGYSVSAATEYHVAVTYEGATARLYVDGVEVASNTTSIADMVGENQFYVGDDDAPGGYDRSLEGTLRGCAIYNRALSASRIAFHASLK